MFAFKWNDEEDKDEEDEDVKKKKKPKAPKTDKFTNKVTKFMKTQKKNFHFLTEDKLIIFGPPIDKDDITDLFDD